MYNEIKVGDKVRWLGQDDPMGPGSLRLKEDFVYTVAKVIEDNNNKTLIKIYLEGIDDIYYFAGRFRKVNTDQPGVYVLSKIKKVEKVIIEEVAAPHAVVLRSKEYPETFAISAKISNNSRMTLDYCGTPNNQLRLKHDTYGQFAVTPAELRKFAQALIDLVDSTELAEEKS